MHKLKSHYMFNSASYMAIATTLRSVTILPTPGSQSRGKGIWVEVGRSAEFLWFSSNNNRVAATELIRSRSQILSGGDSHFVTGPRTSIKPPTLSLSCNRFSNDNGFASTRRLVYATLTFFHATDILPTLHWTRFPQLYETNEL
jgi:hypothetical protein